MQKLLIIFLFTCCGISACSGERVADSDHVKNTNTVIDEQHFSAKESSSAGGACYITVIRDDVNDTQCYDGVSLQTCIKIKNQVVDSTYRFEAGKTCR